MKRSWGGDNLYLGNIPGDGNLELANAPTSLVIMILMLLMIVACFIDCLIHFVSAQVNKLQNAVPVKKECIKLQPTMKL